MQNTNKPVTNEAIKKLMDKLREAARKYKEQQAAQKPREGT